MFPLSRSLHRGNLRSARIRRFIARPLRLSGSHHSRRGHPHDLFLHWSRYSDTCIAHFSKSPCSSLAWLLAYRCTSRCCLRPRGGDFALVFIALITWPAPLSIGSAHSQNIELLGAMCQIQGYTLHLDVLVFPSFRKMIHFPFSRYTTERLTRPYSGGLIRLRRFPSR